MTMKEELEAAKARAHTLEHRVRTLEQQLAAANGTKPAAGSDPTTPAASSEDETLVKLWEQYDAADASQKAAMREEHGSKIDAAAKAYDRAHPAGN